MLIDAHSRIAILDRDECVRLMATQSVGRIAFLKAGAVDVLPVNYVLDGDAVVFATAAGAKLEWVEHGTVAFEVDHTDEETRSGWSIVVHGLAREITDFDPPEIVGRVRALPLRPWAEGERHHLVRIEPTTITGRWVGRGRE